MKTSLENAKESHLKALKTAIRDLKGSLEILETSNVDMDKESLKKEVEVLERRKLEIEMRKK